MASINLSGILTNAFEGFDVGGVLKFTQLSNTGTTIATTEVELVIPPDGAYDIDINFGRIRVDYTTKFTERFIAIVIVDINSLATSIPELLNAAVPVKEDVIIEMESILSDATTEADRAEAAASGVIDLEPRVAQNESDIAALEAGQIGGIITFTTKALLDAFTPVGAVQEATSYKVTNDPSPSNNGYYHWNGASFDKDSDLTTGIVEANNVDATSGGTVYDAILSSEQSLNVFATNIMTNGDFSDDLTGWNNQRWTTADGSTGEFVGESNGVGGFSYTRQTPGLVIGRQYYYSYQINPSRDLVSRVVIQGTTMDIDVSSGVYTTVSGIVIGSTGTNQALFGAFSTLNGDIIKMDNMMLLDLTDIFGAGGEPTAIEMASIMSLYSNNYFDGESVLISSKNLIPLNNANRPNAINITKIIPLNSGFYTYETAHNAIPTTTRVGGLSVSYQTSENLWREDRFISDDVANWEDPKYWLSDVNNIDLHKNELGHGVKGCDTYVNLGTDIVDAYANDVYFEFIMSANVVTIPDITYLYGSSLDDLVPSVVGVNLRRRFDEDFEFAVYDSNNTKQTAIFSTTAGEPAHMIVFVIGELMTYCLNGVILGTAPMVGGMQTYSNHNAKLRPLEPTYLFRVGSTAIVNPVERFNGGLPLEYVATDAIYETKSDGINDKYLKDNVSNLYKDYTDSSAELIDAPYPVEKIGSGVPNFLPQFTRQRYYDSFNDSDYVAQGTILLSDWALMSTSRETDNKQATLISGVNIKTINSESVLGSGNLVIGEGGVVVESNEFENVTAYGAVGNGIVDDTASIEDAIDAALITGNPVFFPNGTFLIKRGLICKNYLQIIGTKGATLKKDPGITQSITENMSIGQTFVKVTNASLYEVGKEIYIMQSPSLAPEGGITYGVINDITSNTLTFTPSEGSAGAEANYLISEGIVVTTAISMVRTNPTIDSVKNVIDGLEFVAQPQPADPLYYFNAVIHFNQMSENTTIRNCVIHGSTGDGISLQGRQRLIWDNNHIMDCNENAMHFGTTGSKLQIQNNLVERAGRNGIFWCFNNDTVIATNNRFVDCRWACGEIDYADRESLIAGNTFEHCDIGVFINGGFDIVISDNIFLRMEDIQIGIDAFDAEGLCITGNLFSAFDSEFQGVAINLDNTIDSTITGNVIREFTGAAPSININDNNAACQRILITGNNISGTGDIGIRLENSIDCLVSSNIIKVGNLRVPIEIDGTSVGLLEVNNIKINV